MLARAKKGKRTCSEILGYDLKGKDSFVINQKEAEYVRFCFDKYLERKNLSEVASLCQERGYRGKRGKIPNTWTISIISVSYTHLSGCIRGLCYDSSLLYVVLCRISNFSCVDLFNGIVHQGYGFLRHAVPVISQVNAAVGQIQRHNAVCGSVVDVLQLSLIHI